MTGTKKCPRAIFPVFFTAALICLILTALVPGVNGASAVDLGSAGNYAILAKSGISTTGTTSINGNIGVSPIAATAITGFGLSKDASNQFATSSRVNGRVFAANYAPPTPAAMTSAISDMESAYTNAAGQGTPSATELYAGNLGGRTLAPGIYKWSTGVLVPSATILTLDAKGNSGAVWIFQVSGDVTLDSASQVVLANSANAENVYWQVAGPSGMTIGTGAHAEGIILTQKAIVLKDGASLHGRALAQTAVTLIANTVTAPTPSSNPVITATPTVKATAGKTPTRTLAPGETATPTLAPGQTATPTLQMTIVSTQVQRYEVIPTSAPEAVKNTVTVNVGGNSDVTKVDVIGTGNKGMIVTGTTDINPGFEIDEAPGVVYQYVRIIPERYSTVDGAMISFSVRRQWLDEKQIIPPNVVLYHLDGATWTALPTTVVEIEGAKVDYVAKSPGFSLFAITGQRDPVTATMSTPDNAYQKSPTLAAAAPTEPAVAQTPVATSIPTTKSPLPVWISVSAVSGVLLVMGLLSGHSRKNS